MDNKLFKVNGKGDEYLLEVLKCAFKQDGHSRTAVGYKVTRQHGLILYWAEDKDIDLFPSPLDAEGVSHIVSQWLKNNQSLVTEFELDEWEQNLDHDGHNSKGWVVYTGDWGHIAGWESFIAIKPVFLWHGK